MQSYDLTLAAEEDLRDIWRYTYETWGFEQAETYFDRIEACCRCTPIKENLRFRANFGVFCTPI